MEMIKALLISIVAVLAVMGFVFGTAFGIEELYRTYAPRNSLTCYNSAFEITYMSPPSEVIGSTPNQYGVWTLESGTYIQNSGETCIVEKPNEEAQVETKD